MDLTAGQCEACPEGFTSLPNATSSYACGKEHYAVQQDIIMKKLGLQHALHLALSQICIH